MKLFNGCFQSYDRKSEVIQCLIVEVEQEKWYIYYIYWVSSGYIQRYSPETEVIFRPRQKNSLGQARAREPCRGRTITEVEVAISLDIARRDPIYIIYIPLFLIPLVTCTNFIDTQLYARLGGHITSRWAYNLDICPPRWAYNPPRGAIYTDIALSGRIFDFFGLYYRGILNKKHQNLVGI